jgi:hypothetical protein
MSVGGDQYDLPADARGSGRSMSVLRKLPAAVVSSVGSLAAGVSRTRCCSPVDMLVVGVELLA